MIRKVLPRWLAWSCYVVALSTSLPAQETLYTHDPAFHIPFNLDQGDQQVDRVRLFCSHDLGKTWQLYQEQAAEAGRFTFRAEADGPYWFTVRLNADSRGDGKSAELKVIVDQERPDIRLEVERDVSGRIIATWNIQDANLDRSSLKMEFATTHQEWQPVPINSSSRSENATGLNGAVEWWVGPHIENVRIRVQAEDLAGNVAVVERQFTAPQPTRLPTPPPPAEPSRDGPPAAVSQDGRRHGTPSRDGWTSVPEATTSPTPPAPGVPGLVGSPPGAVRNSRERRFQLDYDVDVTDQGLHRVEIWYTSDAGQSWKHLGDDPDRQSPYLVEVPQDGLFGFRLVAQATAGFFAQPPISGDSPDVWVHVDSHAPRVRITRAQFGGGDDWGTLHISWESSDESPAEHPVTLLFSHTPEGPWRKLVEGQPGGGSYQWRPDQSMPARFFVRVEARDRVGNVNGHTWHEPLQSQHLQPRARIRDVRPARNGSLFGAPELR